METSNVQGGGGAFPGTGALITGLHAEGGPDPIYGACVYAAQTMTCARYLGPTVAAPSGDGGSWHRASISFISRLQVPQNAAACRLRALFLVLVVLELWREQFGPVA